MSTAKGSKVSFIWMEESTWGTKPGTPAGFKLPIISLGGSWYKQNLVDNPELRSNRNASAPMLGNESVQGPTVFALHLDWVGHLLKHTLSDPTTTTDSPSAGLNTHVFKVGSLPVGLTIEHGYTDIAQYLAYTGCKVDSFGVKAGGEGAVQIDVGFIGKDAESPATSPLDASPTEYTSTAISQRTGTLKEGGSTLAAVTDFSIAYSNNLDASQRGIAGDLLELPEGLAAVTGSVTTLFQNMDLYNKAVANTETSLELAFTSGTHSLTFSLAEVVLEPASPAISGPGGVKQTFNYTAYYQDDSGASAITATLINDTSSY